MSKNTPSIKTTIKCNCVVSLWRTFVRQFFCKLLSKYQWQSLCLGNKEQKLLFLVVSQSDVHIDFDFARPFFCVFDWAQIKLRSKFVQPWILGETIWNFISHVENITFFPFPFFCLFPRNDRVNFHLHVYIPTLDSPFFLNRTLLKGFANA